MLYPLKFEPILKHRIWGGRKLKDVLQKEYADDQTIGESWELSGIEGDESVVINGELAGNTINDLLEIYMDELVGGKVFDQFGFTFPLLFKFLDANENLSIQVHPTDEIAEEQDSFGKTEMWYVINAEEGAELIVGFSEPIDKDTFLQHMQNGTLESILKKEKVRSGDVFFIPAGLIHSIGKGILLAEIQQSSDLTYRIYDYNRVDENGNPRPLHIEQALEVIDFENHANAKVQYQKIVNQSASLVKCEYFTTNLLSFDKTISKDYSDLDSFVVLMCLSGSFEIKWDGGKELVSKGETILIPSELGQIDFITQKVVDVLEVSVG